MEILIRIPTEEQIEEVKTWPIWEKEVSKFPWEYSEEERFLIIKGKAIITPEYGEKRYIKSGQFVTMPKGLKCTWEIIEPFKKHYKFG